MKAGVQEDGTAIVRGGEEQLGAGCLRYYVTGAKRKSSSREKQSLG